jgi:hypothetical protein
MQLSSWMPRATGLLLGSFALLALPSLASGAGEASSPVDAASPLDAKIEREAYVCEIATNGAYQAGTQGTVKITLNAKGDRHINPDYPHKFTTTDPAPEGVTYPKPVLTKADGSFDEKLGTFNLPFTAAKAGKVKIGGTFRFSVCNDSQCLMEKVDLALDVDVK